MGYTLNTAPKEYLILSGTTRLQDSSWINLKKIGFVFVKLQDMNAMYCVIP